mmetsp:Transcript_49223/g.107331  ORF Transcript_49223/g.107331 Transcript_49223/m.107331 type:complete len:1135 (-) Transcript_49223:616-4020(-)
MTSLQDLTKDVATMLAKQDELQAFCPEKCDTDPSIPIDASTLGGVIFVVAVGFCVGTDVTIDSFRQVASRSRWPFGCGMLCQFILMPLFTLVLSHIFKDDMESDALYSFPSAVLGLQIVGCLPGGTTSNLFTWFCGGNVPLSIMMSVVSNVVALGSLPLLLYLLYELRFEDQEAPTVPYSDILLPLILTVIAVAGGMTVKAKCSAEVTWWVAKISSIFSIIFLVAALAIGVAKYSHIMDSSYSFFFCGIMIQPMGYLFGWGLAHLAGCSLKDKMTIAFETGVQSFTLGLVIANLSFNVEKESCQFAPECMSLLGIKEGGLTKYTDAFDFDVGDALGQISIAGIAPGEFAGMERGGCCRYNEAVFTDVFKFSALCSMMYPIHAFWMIMFFRKMFPNGHVRSTDKFVKEEWTAWSKKRVTDPSQECEPYFADSLFGSEKGTSCYTIPDLLDQAAARAGNEVALAYEGLVEPCPKEDKMKATEALPFAKWKKWTWSQFQEDSNAVARSLIALGVQHFGSVTLYGFNCPQWNIGAVGAICAGAKAAGIYPTDTVEQVSYKTKHSGAAVAIVEDMQKVQRYKQCLDSVPKLNAIVVYGGVADCADLTRTDGTKVKVMNWDSFVAAGKTGADGYEKNEQERADRRTKTRPGHACCLVYTSGTTGMPKAVMLSHDNCSFGSRISLNLQRHLLGVEYEQERILSYLPLSHVAGFLLDVIMPIALTATTKGFCTVYGARSYDLKEGTLKNRLLFVRPTVFLGVPRVWEKFAERLMEVGAKTKGMMPILCCIRKKTCAAWAKKHGLRSQRNLQVGKSGRTTCCYGLAEGMVLSKVRAALGLDCMKVGITGAAPINLETLEYFGSLGININELYGMSESTAMTTVSTEEHHLWGSCGSAAPGVQVKVFKIDGKNKKECPLSKDIFNPTEEEQGELCFRGRHIMMGYMANPDLGPEHVAQIEKQTADAIDDEGWLHSGDMGVIGENGMVKVTGRYKELIITAGGENVAPVPIEENIKKLCPAVSNCMMIGDKKKYNTCLITLKTEGATGEMPGTEQLTGPAAEVISGVTTISQAAASAEYRKVIEQAIAETNKNSFVCPSNASKIQKFEILPTDFSVQGDELTPTLKLKRKVAEGKYQEIIAKMYE